MSAAADSTSTGAPSETREPGTPAAIAYRADVDGLRAIAVVAVLFYHLDLGWAAGGFVGVDVFFVISGYLITSILRRDLATGAYSIARFYSRRIRRLFPALFVAMTFVAITTAWLFAPDDFKRVGQSLAAAATFLSNFYFAKDAGYFTEPAATKPLLHTWSLSVEEQFYIFFPIYLRAIARLPTRRQIVMTACVGACSLVASVALLRAFPVQTFYFLPTRVWQLLLGALLAFWSGSIHIGRFRNALSILGLVLIIGPVAHYSHETQFPGIAALPPTVGAALFIATGTQRLGVINRILSRQPFVVVGRMSYSIYLWHFPLIGLASYLTIGPRPWTMDVALVLASCIAGGLSFRFVEHRFREHGQRPLAARAIVIGLGTMVVLATFGVVVHLKQGFPGRFTGERLALVSAMTDRWTDWQRCMYVPPERISSGDVCAFGPDIPGAPRTLVWGDSHAEAIAPGVVAAAEQNAAGMWFAGRHGCAPGASIKPALEPFMPDGCAAFDRAVLQLLSRESVEEVVIASRWVALNPPTGRGNADEYAAALGQLVDSIRGRQVVWLVGPTPGLKYAAPRSLYVQSLGFGRDTELRTTRAAFLEKEAPVLRVLTQLCERSNVRCVWPHESLCRSDLCEVVADGRPLYFDDNHLSATGARRLSTMFEPIFRQRR